MNTDDSIDYTDPFQLLGVFLREDKWNPEKVADLPAYEFIYEGKNGKMPIYAWIREGKNQLFIHVDFVEVASAEKRQIMSEFFTRVNWGLESGNFELNMDTGAIRFKASLDFAGIILMPALIRNILYHAFNTSDAYLPGIKEIMQKEVSAKEAFEKMK